MVVWGQIIGIVAMVAIILSFQCKSNRKLAVVIGTGALLFAISYLMLRQPTAAVFNLISVICSFVCMKDKLKTKTAFGIIVALYITATIYTYSGWWSMVLALSMIASSYSIMFASGTFIRNMRFFFISPVWLINNTVVCFTVGGIICEIITMVSVIVSVIRYRKTGFEK